MSGIKKLDDDCSSYFNYVIKLDFKTEEGVQAAKDLRITLKSQLDNIITLRHNMRKLYYHYSTECNSMFRYKNNPLIFRKRAFNNLRINVDTYERYINYYNKCYSILWNTSKRLNALTRYRRGVSTASSDYHTLRYFTIPKMESWTSFSKKKLSVSSTATRAHGEKNRLTYRELDNIIFNKYKVPIYIISAPSGTGRTTLINRLVASRRSYERPITTTTRPIRNAEINGIDYYFISDTDYNLLVDNGKFILSHQYKIGYRYGLLSSILDRILIKKVSPILQVHPAGLEAVKKILYEKYGNKIYIYSIYIYPPHPLTIRSRLRKRYTAEQLKDPSVLADIRWRMGIFKRDEPLLGLYDEVFRTLSIEHIIKRINYIDNYKMNRIV